LILELNDIHIGCLYYHLSPSSPSSSSSTTTATSRRRSFSSCKPDELLTRYNAVTNELNELQANLKGHEAAIDFYRRALEEHEALAARYKE
jgi:hypothetical protein